MLKCLVLIMMNIWCLLACLFVGWAHKGFFEDLEKVQPQQLVEIRNNNNNNNMHTLSAITNTSAADAAAATSSRLKRMMKLKDGLGMSRRKSYWKFFSKDRPSLYDAFAHDSLLHIVFQCRKEHCRHCILLAGDTPPSSTKMLFDFNGASKEPSWSCIFFGGILTEPGSATVDPDGHALVITCRLPTILAKKAKGVVTVIAQAKDEKPWIYAGAEYFATFSDAGKVWLAGCTMVKPSMIMMDQGRLLEWVAFHIKLQEFDHIWIYSDGDAAALRNTLKLYVDEGRVFVVDWEWPDSGFHHQQAQMYSCLYRHKGLAEWVAFFDMDEYFQPLLQGTVANFLQFQNLNGLDKNSNNENNENVAGVMVLMVLFDPLSNANEDSSNSPALITQKAFVRSSQAWPPTSRSKCIARPDYVSAIGVHLIFHGGPVVIADAFQELRLNHYRAGLEMIQPPEPVLDKSMTVYGPALRSEVKRITGI